MVSVAWAMVVMWIYRFSKRRLLYESFYEFNGQNLKMRRYADYDGEWFRIPVEAEKVLTQHYGDRRSLPPEESRKGHFAIKLPTT